MKLLLVNPNSFQPAGENRIRYYPMNYAYISSFLKAQGHRVEMIDALWDDLSPGEVVTRVLEWPGGFDYVGLGGQINYYSFIKEFVALYRERGGEKHVLIGGPITFGLEKELIRLIPGIDFAVLGEGLDTLLSLFDIFDGDKNRNELGKIHGLAYKRDGQMVSTGYPTERDVNTLPYPDWNLADYEKYLRGSFLHFGHRSAHVIAGRGCPFKCVYCSAHFNGLRLRSVDHVIGEITLLKERFGVDDIVFLDETFTYDRKWLKALCQGMRGLGLTWLARTRVDLVDRNTLIMMKNSGCRTVNYGIESGSETILKSMNKKVSIHRIEKALALTREIGLHFTTNFMVGMPFETLETLHETLQFLLRNDLRCGFAYTYPLPGTDLFNQAGIEDLDAYLSEVKGYFYDKLIVNLTKLSDEILVREKERVEYIASYSYFQKRAKLLTPLFHRLFYTWHLYAKENPYLLRPLNFLRKMAFRHLQVG